MNRRDTVVNTLLGALLLTVAFLPIVLGYSALVFARWAISHLAKQFFPGVVAPAYFPLILVVTVVSLVSGVRSLRKERWRNAFLYFAIAPTMLLIGLATGHSSLGIDGNFGMLILLPILAIPSDSAATRSQFFVGASFIWPSSQ